MNKTPTVGIHHGVPAAEYHQWDAVSHSWLSKIRISPAHLLDLIESGPTPPTPAMMFGTAVHARVLEPDLYDQQYVVRPEGQSGATKAGRALRADADAHNQIVLSSEQGRAVEAIARRARLNSRAAEWLKAQHETEVSIVWERNGYMCKARLDLVVLGLRVIADLKTCISASPMGFARQIARYHLHTQCAWYADGMRALTGEDWTTWLLACEKRRPFLVSAYELVPGSQAHGAALAEIDAAFALYAECRASGHWPGYGDEFPVDLPAWAIHETEDDEEPFD